MMPNPMMMMAMCQMMMMKKAMQERGGGGGDEGGDSGGRSSGGMSKGIGVTPTVMKHDPLLNYKPGTEPTMDPEVRELGDYFNIEERWVKRLNEAVVKRMDTKEQDLAKLYEVLERARSPTGLLTVKIGEMESGQFVGKVKPDKDVERIARKFKLDDYVTSRLTELVVRRKETKDDDLMKIEQHLRYCKRPSAMATLLAGKLLEGEVESLPCLKNAERMMTTYKLDEDARSKLREIVEKRAQDQDQVLKQIEKHLETSANASSMLCKIARPLIDGETIADPPENARRYVPGEGKGGGKGKDRGDGDRPSTRESRGGGGYERDRRDDRGGGSYRDDRRGGGGGGRERSRDRRDRSRDRRGGGGDRDRGGGDNRGGGGGGDHW